MLTTSLRDAAFTIPTTAESMNYNSVILVGVVCFTAAWWLIHARRHYPGPKVMALYIHEGQPPLGHAAAAGEDGGAGAKEKESPQ